MKLQISNQYGFVIQIVFFGVGMTAVFVFGFVFIDDFSINQLSLMEGISVLVAALLCFYSTTFYAVSFDDELIYFSRHRSVKKLAFEEIVSIKPGILPIRIYYSNIYVVTIRYLDKGHKRKIRFLSKGSRGIMGTNDKVPFLDVLRQRIKEKKYAINSAIEVTSAKRPK